MYRSPQRPVKETTRGEIPDEVHSNKKKVFQSEDARKTEIATENLINAKRMADNPLQSELVKSGNRKTSLN